MNSHETGLSRELRPGDYVILSTGAIAQARKAYPEGYSGTVSIELDGQPMSELATTLVLPETGAHVTGAASVFEHAATEEARVKEPDKRMHP